MRGVLVLGAASGAVLSGRVQSAYNTTLTMSIPTIQPPPNSGSTAVAHTLAIGALHSKTRAPAAALASLAAAASYSSTTKQALAKPPQIMRVISRTIETELVHGTVYTLPNDDWQ